MSDSYINLYSYGNYLSLYSPRATSLWTSRNSCIIAVGLVDNRIEFFARPWCWLDLYQEGTSLYECACIWRPRSNHEYCHSGATPLLLWEKLEPGALWLGWTGWPLNHRHPPVSTSPAMGLQMLTTYLLLLCVCMKRERLRDRSRHRKRERQRDTEMGISYLSRLRSFLLPWEVGSCCFWASVCSWPVAL